MVDCLGWAATAVFVGSYFCTSPDALRRTQMIGAAMWMAYAVVMHAAPVLVANFLVLCAAAWTAIGSPRRGASRPIETRRLGDGRTARPTEAFSGRCHGMGGMGPRSMPPR